MEKERIKCVIVGDENSGKTALVSAFISGTFISEHSPTVFDCHDVDAVLEGNTVPLKICDTGGSEISDRMRPLCYAKANVILLCVDVMNPQTMQTAESFWMREINHFCSKVPVLVVGTKTDLKEKKGRVKTLKETQKRGPLQYEEARKASWRMGAFDYVQCSAKTSKGILNVFSTAVRIALNSRK